MKKFYEFPDYEQDSFHDVIIDVGLDVNGIEEYYESLPRHIKSTGEEWGLNDTVFGDEACEFLTNLEEE